jgi:hypothetical protein
MSFIKVASATVGSGGSSKIQLLNIPQTYKHLIVFASIKTNRSAINDGFFAYLNGNTSNYSAISRLYGTGSTTVADGGASILCPSVATSTNSSFSNSVIVIPHYTGNKNKSVEAMTLVENNGTSGYPSQMTYTWRNTSAVTSIELVPETGTGLEQYSSAIVYATD